MLIRLMVMFAGLPDRWCWPMAQKSNSKGGVSARAAPAGGGRMGENGLEDGAGSSVERIGVGAANGAGDGTAMGGKTCTSGGGGGGSWAFSRCAVQTRDTATPSSLANRCAVAS